MSVEPALCGAKARGGAPCRKLAGFGTDHVGFGACKYHAGSTRTGRTAAYKEQARAEAARLGGEVPLNPDEALTWAVAVAAGSVAFFQRKLREVEDAAEKIDGAGAIALTRALSAEAEKLARVAKVAADAGIEERRLALDSLVLDKIGGAVTRAIADAGLASADRKRLNDALRVRLTELADDDLRPQGLGR